MSPHDQKTRLEVIRLHFEEKESMSKISRNLSISYTSIRLWINRYKKEGEKGLLPKYREKGKPSKFSKEVIDQAIAYKREHPQWGAPFILLKLEDTYTKSSLPKARWLQQIFKRANLQPRKNRLPKSKVKWAKAVFDCVQVDANERLKTADGKACCYLNFVDEYSGSELEAFLFPLCTNQRSLFSNGYRMRTIRHVPMGTYQMFSF